MLYQKFEICTKFTVINTAFWNVRLSNYVEMLPFLRYVLLL